MYLKTTKKITAKQISKQNKTKKKKREEGKKKVVIDPTSHSHYAIEDDHVIW